MTRPAISLLASALGKSADLAEMIDSVREQTSPDWELIVADDGASAAVLARYAEDARIRTVSVLDNGLGPAIDAAAAVATGPCYAVVHGDGKIVPSFCERVTGLLAARRSTTWWWTHSRSTRTGTGPPASTGSWASPTSPGSVTASRWPR